MGYLMTSAPEVPVWRSPFPKTAGMTLHCVLAKFKHWLYCNCKINR